MLDDDVSLHRELHQKETEKSVNFFPPPPGAGVESSNVVFGVSHARLPSRRRYRHVEKSIDLDETIGGQEDLELESTHVRS